MELRGVPSTYQQQRPELVERIKIPLPAQMRQHAVVADALDDVFPAGDHRPVTAVPLDEAPALLDWTLRPPCELDGTSVAVDCDDALLTHL